MLARSILVVEDDVDIREALSGLLVEEGYAVSSCANGLEALTHLRKGKSSRADIILLDLMMPVMDGWQFRVLQKRDPELASIPVLAISADSTPKAAAIDADVYLRKPIDRDALLSAIERTMLGLERRMLQSALAETERLAALGTLAAGVAHEINNPLAYVMANVVYAARVMDDPAAPAKDRAEARTALAEAEEGCGRIRAIVRDLKMFSRTRDEDRGPVDVRRVLDSSVNIIMHEIRPRARLVREYRDVPAIVANEGRIAQLFSNLVLNAAQAIPEGDATKNEIRLVTSVDGAWVTVEVSDTGSGIPEDVRGRIFDPFFTTKPVGVGTGLGLSIAHRIVREAGGEIEVSSALGKGTIFRVRFPVAATQASVAPVAPDPKTAPRRARILIIDDEAMIGATLERALGDAHDVESTTSPVEAIDRVRRGERFDLILCDMMMPDKTGIEVHADIEAASPEQADRMIFLTGGATNRRTQEFLARQRNPVAEKPFVTSELLAQIDGALATLDARHPRH